MISVDMIFLGTGSVLAYAFDAAFYKVNHGWRYMVGLGALPSILLGVFLFLCKSLLLLLRAKSHCIQAQSRRVNCFSTAGVKNACMS